MDLMLFSIFILLLWLGVPIAIAMGIAAFWVIWQADLGLFIVSPNFYAGLAKFQLLAIPFFILAGYIFERCGISERLVRLAHTLVGNRPGGLAIVAILVCVFFGGISGSGPADAAAIGAILIPAMVAEGYGRGFAAGLMASGGATAIIVPPSIGLILYGALTNTSITTLFAAGIMPGLLAGFSLLIPAWLISQRRGYGVITVKSTESTPFWPLFREALWGLMAPIIILGGLYGGLFTPTEAAVVAVCYALFLGFVVYRSLTLKQFYQTLVDASIASAVVMLIVTLAGLFSWTANTLGVFNDISQQLIAFHANPMVVLILIHFILLIVGMMMDAVSIYYIFLPIFIPIMLQFGWDPVWFGIMMTFNLAIGQFTPPVAINLYVTTHIANIPVEQTFKEVIPFVLSMLMALVVIILFPQLSFIFPQLFGMI